MTGAFVRSMPKPGSNVSEWQNTALCQTLGSNNNYLRLMEMWARAYTTPGQRYYRDADLLDRVTAGIDFYTRAQGSNGGYDDRNHGHCWLGGPTRRPASGCLEGYGHMGFSHAFYLLRDVYAESALLNAAFDDDFDPGTANVTRRQGWAQLFLRSRNYLASSVGRGHAPNQVE